MDNKKLQQDAFMWFKDRFGVVPEEKGLMMFTFMRNRFFIKSPWVIFAPNEKTAKAVDKGQSVIEFALNWSLSAILIVGCLAVCLYFAMVYGSDRLGIFFIVALAVCLSTMVVLIICCRKNKLLNKLCCRDVVIYTAAAGRDEKAAQEYLLAILKEKIPQMTTSEISVRISVLFDELEDAYLPLKALEYELLCAEYRKRQQV